MRYLFLILLLPGCATIPTNGYDSVLKYNYYDKEWSYQRSDSQLKFNYYENRWEWTK